MARRRTSVLNPAARLSTGVPGDPQGGVGGEQPAQDLLVVQPAVAEHREGAPQVPEDVLVEELLGHGHDPALTDAGAEQLAVLDQPADRRQGDAQPLGDVGDGQPGADRVFQVRMLGGVRRGLFGHGTRVPAGAGKANRSRK